MHDKEDEFTSLDFNRAGVPLIEIVTEPCLSNADEAVAFLTNLRRILRFLAVCDGNMEEGSLVAMQMYPSGKGDKKCWVSKWKLKI